MNVARTRRWYRLHWLTWVAVLIECAAIGYRQTREWFFGFSSMHHSLAVIWDSGWPAISLERIEHWTHPSSQSASLQLSDLSRAWFPPSLAFDCACWVLLVCSVGFVVENRLRMSKRWQFSLCGLGLMTAVTGALLTLAKQHEFLNDGISLLGMEPALRFDSFGSSELNAADWTAACVILCGAGCTIWTVTHGGIYIAARLFRSARPVSVG